MDDKGWDDITRAFDGIDEKWRDDKEYAMTALVVLACACGVFGLIFWVT